MVFECCRRIGRSNPIASAGGTPLFEFFGSRSPVIEGDQEVQEAVRGSQCTGNPDRAPERIIDPEAPMSDPLNRRLTPGCYGRFPRSTLSVKPNNAWVAGTWIEANAGAWHSSLRLPRRGDRPFSVVDVRDCA
jgi:hypothetical protein